MFAFAGIKTGCDKRKEQRCLLVFVFALLRDRLEIKERNQKKREDACLFVFVHFYQNQKWNKKLGLGFVHGGLH